MYFPNFFQQECALATPGLKICGSFYLLKRKKNIPLLDILHSNHAITVNLVLSH